jgi:iron complex outermembrane recepter protein
MLGETGALVRARKQSRVYGGEDFLDLGPSQIGVQDFRPEPVARLGARTSDDVRQHTFGIAYQGRWKGLGELSLGLQKTDYKKQVDGIAPGVDAPWLVSATGAAYLSSRLAIYGGYSTGLEESPVAPSNASNLNEAPPAIRTKQKEAGLRWNVSPGVTMVLGLFDISKPYFNLDAAQRFRQLGNVRHRGIEMSLAGQIAEGLSLVAGNVLLDAKISGEEVRLGLIGPKPIGSFVRHTVIALDYQLPWHTPLTLTANFEGTSDRTANAANSFVVPARAVMSLGARYKFNIGKVPSLLRECGRWGIFSPKRVKALFALACSGPVSTPQASQFFEGAVVWANWHRSRSCECRLHGGRWSRFRWSSLWGS